MAEVGPGLEWTGSGHPLEDVWCTAGAQYSCSVHQSTSIWFQTSQESQVKANPPHTAWGIPSPLNTQSVLWFQGFDPNKAVDGKALPKVV